VNEIVGLGVLLCIMIVAGLIFMPMMLEQIGMNAKYKAIVARQRTIKLFLTLSALVAIVSIVCVTVIKVKKNQVKVLTKKEQPIINKHYHIHLEQPQDIWEVFDQNELIEYSKHIPGEISQVPAKRD
jgi:membrane-anchored glycerophosphoryl diester phosphodiesterase (GDPDase)